MLSSILYNLKQKNWCLSLKKSKPGLNMNTESCLTTNAIVWHEVKKTISYRRLEPQKYLVSIGLPCSGFPFYGHFNRQFTYAVFVIFNTVWCIWVKRFYTNTLFFGPAWNSFSSENILYVIILAFYSLKKVLSDMCLSIFWYLTRCNSHTNSWCPV